MTQTNKPKKHVREPRMRSNDQRLVGLIVKQPWANMIINCEKTMELRSRAPPVNYVQRSLGLLSKGYLLGIIAIESYGPIRKAGFVASAKKHRCDVSECPENYYAYAWNIKVLARYVEPRKYKHPNGAQIWVKDVVEV